MFSANNYLHYVLDTTYGDHFTDDMLRLSPEAFLWHQLKEHCEFEAVVFLSGKSDRVQLTVYDMASEQFCKQTKQSAFESCNTPEVGIQRHCFLSNTLEIPDAGLFSRLRKRPKDDAIISNENLLNWLIKSQKNQRSTKTALVISAELLEALYQNYPKKIREALELGNKGGFQGILVIRLPRDAKKLQEAFQHDRYLSQLDDDIAAVTCGREHRPLLKMLQEHLSGRLVDFGNCTAETENMLLYEALESGNGLDSPEQLRDQANYLCLGHCYETDPDLQLPPTFEREALYKILKNPVFRNQLRQTVAQLRQADDSAHLETLMCAHYSPRTDGFEPGKIYYSDKLVNRVHGLPAVDPALAPLSNVPTQLYRTLRTLWNTPRNPQVCEMIKYCCKQIDTAHSQQDLGTFHDALLVLKVCTRYLCAPPEMDNLLKDLFTAAKSVMELSQECFNTRQARQDVYQVQTGYHNGDTKTVNRFLGSSDLQHKEFILGVTREELHYKITIFDTEQPNTQADFALMENKLAQKNKDVEQRMADLQKGRHLEQQLDALRMQKTDSLDASRPEDCSDIQATGQKAAAPSEEVDNFDAAQSVSSNKYPTEANPSAASEQDCSFDYMAERGHAPPWQSGQQHQLLHPYVSTQEFDYMEERGHAPSWQSATVDPLSTPFRQFNRMSVLGDSFPDQPDLPRPSAATDNDDPYDYG